MRLLLTLLFLFALISLHAQQDVFYGNWVGTITVDSSEIKAVMYIKKGDTCDYIIRFDFPEQGFENLKLGKYFLGKDSVFIDVKKVRSKYYGHFDEASGKIVGKWWQMGKEYPLTFEKTEKDFRLKRPQTPLKPYPYKEEEVSFFNATAKIHLSGTLSIPEGKGPFPAVLIINGSGQQERDCEIMGHQWSLVLSDYLTRQGIVTLRYDDRGTGQSEGNPYTSNTLDFATDATAAAMFLRQHKSVIKEKTGIIGHSEGGIIAQMIASKTNQVAFVVLLAAPGIDVMDLMVIQNRKIVESENILKPEQFADFDKMTRSVFNTILKVNDNQQASKEILSIYMDYAKTLDSAQIKKLNLTEKNIRAQLISLLSPWYRFFISIKPSRYLTKIKCPVLALNGEKDMQVTPDENLAAINDALRQAKNTKVTIQKMPDLNHLFQHAEKGSVAEYAKIEETISPEVLQIISSWIIKQ